MSAIIIAKIIYSGFLASCASGAAPIIRISRVPSSLRLSIVSYLNLGSVLSIKLVLDLGSGSLRILFIVEC